MVAVLLLVFKAINKPQFYISFAVFKDIDPKNAKHAIKKNYYSIFLIWLYNKKANSSVWERKTLKLTSLNFVQLIFCVHFQNKCDIGNIIIDCYFFNPFYASLNFPESMWDNDNAKYSLF